MQQRNVGRRTRGSAAPRAIASAAGAMHVRAGSAERVIALYECPPLQARLTARRCALNRERARAPLSAHDSHRWRGDLAVPGTPRECATCPGVLWFAEGSGRAPRELAVAELVRAHAAGEERRRRTRVAEEERSARSLRPEDVAALVGLNGPL